MSKNYMYRSMKRSKKPAIIQKIKRAIRYWIDSIKMPLIATMLIIALLALTILALLSARKVQPDTIVLSSPVPEAKITVIDNVTTEPTESNSEELATVEIPAESEANEDYNPFDIFSAQAEENEGEIALDLAEVIPIAESNALIYSTKGDFPAYVDWYKPDVEMIQARLSELGYYTGKIDGEFGPTTGEALKAFQRAKKLTVDGIAGPATLSKMGIKSKLTYPEANYCYMVNLEEAASKSSSKYLIEIRYQNQKAYGGNGKPVMVLYEKKNGYWHEIKTVYCTPGKSGKTPLGVFAALRKGGTFSKDDGKTEWRNPTWFHDEKRPTKEDPKHIACFGIHSTGYNTATGKYDNSVLGSRVSAGCVRVHPEVANWIYNHCKKGTTIVINDR